MLTVGFNNIACNFSGTTIGGHVDNLQRLLEVCKQHDIWLHVRGHSLAAVAMVSVPNMVSRCILYLFSCGNIIIRIRENKSVRAYVFKFPQ